MATLRRAHPICCWALERTRPLGSPMKPSRVHAAFPGSCRHGRGRSSGPRHGTDELENSTPGGRSPTLGTACCRIPLRRMSGTGRATGRAAQRWWAGAAGTGGSSQCQWGWASPFGGEESVLTSVGSAITQRHEHTNHHWAACTRESHLSKTCCTTVATQRNTLLRKCVHTHTHTHL